MARRSGSVTAVDVPFEDWGLDLFRRGFFDTGICLAPTVCAALQIIAVVLPTSIGERTCPPFVRFIGRIRRYAFTQPQSAVFIPGTLRKIRQNGR
jgi:hypothetical protein